MSATSLQGLRVFCAAARSGSFKLAAEEIFVSASAVSHRIKNLEERLGIPLFERQTRAVKLTEFGESLLNKVEPLLDEIDEVIESLSGVVKTTAITLTLPPFFSTELLIPRLHEFTAEHQNIIINLDTLNNHPEKHQNSSDLSILLCEKPPLNAISEKLFSLTLVPACSPDLHFDRSVPLLNVLSDVTLLIHRPRSKAWKHWYNRQGFKGKIPANVIVLDSMFAVVRAAEQGLGVALVPEALTRSLVVKGILEILDEQKLITGDSYYLVNNSDTTRKKEVSELKSWIEEVFKSNDE